MIGWMIYANSDEVDEVEVDRFDAVAKSDTLDFEKGVNLCILRNLLDGSRLPCVKLVSALPSVSAE